MRFLENLLDAVMGTRTRATVFILVAVVIICGLFPDVPLYILWRFLRSFLVPAIRLTINELVAGLGPVMGQAMSLLLWALFFYFGFRFLYHGLTGIARKRK